MSRKNLFAGLLVIVTVVIAIVLLLGTNASAQETVLNNFTVRGGYYPNGNLTLDSAGNLYGGTGAGGTYDQGAVYELSPQSGGGWTETVLHFFGKGIDGWPGSGSLIADGKGNFYGVTNYGGAYGSKGYYIGGTAFELIPEGGKRWKEVVLHSFGSGTDAAIPLGGLVSDVNGNLYGITVAGGDNGAGTVFELSQVGGVWKESVLHSFGSGKDGANPNCAKLAIDSVGNLYGTTVVGGTFHRGVVFELTRQAGGGWKEAVLQSFGANGKDDLNGVYPLGLAFDSSGNLYGVTAGGGFDNSGVAFALSPGSAGGWVENVIYTFGSGADGIQPNSPLVFDASGNLYGTTAAGGEYDIGNALFGGTVFELTPVSGQLAWNETLLHSFGNSPDGAVPTAGVIFDGSGNLYGTTEYSTTPGAAGTLWRITP
jgi:uncharacterized repeat protein (TIGR03803 family)